MTARLAAREQRISLDDASLARRATQLCRQYLGGAARPRSVRWVDNQQSRWGSCTPARGTIRISHRVGRLPEWVLDYVLIHELAHLLAPGHGRDFWALVAAYPLTERARGFLDGVAAAARLDLSQFDGVTTDDDEPPGSS
jgi:predicted metal-dependent hydrolase